MIISLRPFDLDKAGQTLQQLRVHLTSLKAQLEQIAYETTWLIEILSV